MKRHYIIYLGLMVIVCTSGGIAIGLNLQPEPELETSDFKNEYPVEEYIKERNKELDSKDTVVVIPKDTVIFIPKSDVPEPIIRVSRYRHQPIEAPERESR